MVDDLKRRYQDEEVKKLLVMASALTPKFKNLAFLSNDEREAGYQQIRESAVNNIRASQATVDEVNGDNHDVIDVDQPAEIQRATDGFFDDNILGAGDDMMEQLPVLSDDTIIATEIEGYRREPVSAESYNVVVVACNQLVSLRPS